MSLNSKIISLGHACPVRHNINIASKDKDAALELFKSTEAYIFDWFISDFDSVLCIFKMLIEDEAFLDSDFTTENVFYNSPAWTECYKIECMKFKLISV